MGYIKKLANGGAANPFGFINKLANGSVSECYLLNEINVMQSTTLELSSASRKDQVLPGDINPILVPLVLHQLCMRNIAIPYLKQKKLCQLGTQTMSEDN